MAADAGMTAFPHVECPLIVPQFSRLVSTRVVRGYGTNLRQALGGGRGCAHLYELARNLGASAALRGACHIWAQNGLGEPKTAAD